MENETLFTITTTQVKSPDFKVELKNQDYTKERAQTEICELHKILDDLSIGKITKEQAVDRYQPFNWYSKSEKISIEEFQNYLNKK